MSGIHDSDTIEDYIAICERAAADPRYQQFRAAMAHRIRTHTRTLIHDTSVSDDEYHRRTTSYDLEQFKSFLRDTAFLYAEARAVLAANGDLGKPAATPAAARGNAEPTTPTSSATTRSTRSVPDGFYDNPWYVAARCAMATRIRQFDMSMIDDPDVSDEQFHTRSDDFSYRQTRQLFIETIDALGVANAPT